MKKFFKWWIEGFEENDFFGIVKGISFLVFLLFFCVAYVIYSIHLVGHYISPHLIPIALIALPLLIAIYIYNFVK